MQAFSLPPPPSTSVKNTTSTTDVATIAAAVCERAAARNRARLANLALAKQNWEAQLAQLRSNNNNSTQYSQPNTFGKIYNPEALVDYSDEIRKAYFERMKNFGVSIEQEGTVSVISAVNQKEDNVITETAEKSKQVVAATMATNISTVTKLNTSATAAVVAQVEEEKAEISKERPVETVSKIVAEEPATNVNMQLNSNEKDDKIVQTMMESKMLEQKEQKTRMDVETEEEESVQRPNLIEYFRDLFIRLSNQGKQATDESNEDNTSSIPQPQV